MLERDVLLSQPTELSKLCTQNHHSFIQLTSVSAMHITAVDLHL